MADVWAKLLDILSNGPPEIGISAGADAFNAAANSIILHRRAEQDPAEYLGMVGSVNSIGRSARVRRITAAGAAFIAAHPMRVEQGKYRLLADVPAGTHTVDVGIKDVTDAILLITASKVNWWTTNHHTGQKVTQGYFKKAADISEIPTEDAEELNALWQMCHWACTTTVLGALGIRGLVDHSDAAAVFEYTRLEGAEAVWPTGSEDVKLRISSHPAGTAHLFVAQKVSELIKGTQYARFIPREAFAGYRDLNAAVAQIRGNPARFHIGAHYLTGAARIVAPDVAPIIQRAVSAYCLTVIKGVSIANSPSIRKFEMDKDLESVFNTTRAAGAKAGEALQGVLGKLTASRIGGDAFADEATYARQIAEVQDMMQQEESEDSS